MMVKISSIKFLKIYSSAVIFLFFAFLHGPASAQSIEENRTRQEPVSLYKAYADMFKIGVALNRWQFEGNVPQATPLIIKHFNAISPENALKWSSLETKPGKYNFDAADKYVAFGERHNMFILGHNLVWHTQIPRWTFIDKNGNQLDRNALLQRMKDHIFKVVGRYKGRIDAWDVVNEAALPNGLRKSKWYKIIGEEYLDKAFRYAHEADPDAELYYNDYNLSNPAKRETVIRMVQRLQKNDVQIDGIGMQMHIGLNDPSIDEIEKSINAFLNLG